MSLILYIFGAVNITRMKLALVVGPTETLLNK